MPKINLRDPDSGPGGNLPDDQSDEMSPPPLPGDPDQSGTPKWLIIGGAVLLLGVVVVALNQFKVIHLWGKKAAKVVEALPEPSSLTVDSTALAAQQAVQAAPAESTPLPTEPKPEPAPAKAAKTSSAKHSGGAAATSHPASATRASRSQSGGSGFSIQMSSWPTRGAADRASQALTSAGLSPSVSEGDVSGKTWYRVRIGSYGSMAEAKKGLDDLRAKGVTEGIVVRADR